MNHRIGLSLATLLFASMTLTSGCVSHRVSAMVYTQHNPYAPYGVLYESWEQKREIDGILNDTRLTHTAIGAAGGAIAGQAIGRNTKNTLWGTGIGAVAGLTHGSVSDHNRKIAHEDHMTRLANDWQINHNHEIHETRVRHPAESHANATILQKHFLYPEQSEIGSWLCT